ncbi:MAG: hypothetical protein P1P76_08555 [Anaerolineales bacterium]|nr:hypothetical protein [Anaerolineales bacterium]
MLFLSLNQGVAEGIRPLTPYGFRYLQSLIIPVSALLSFFLFALLTKARNPQPPKPFLQAFFITLSFVLTYWAATAPLRPNWLLLIGVWLTFPLLYAADVRLVGQNALISLASIIVTLILLELLLRPFPQIWPRYAQIVGSNWRRLHADIPDISYEKDGVLYQTNSIGFRGSNPVPEKVDVAALGDSFTFGVGSETPWPVQLEQVTGLQVLNLGMGGTDPPKHVYPLVGFGLNRDPSFVIEGYFEGNDFFTCYQPARPSGPRWGDRLILPDVAGSLFQTLRSGWREQKITSELTYNSVTPFQKTINGREVLLTFSPAYSATLLMDRETLSSSENWRITTGSLLRMQQLTERSGGIFMLVFLPDRTHVYWPLIRGDEALVRTLNEDMIYHWQESFGCYVLVPGRKPADLESFRQAVDRSINDQRALLTEFAQSEGIHLLDLTGPLRDLAAQGLTLHDPLETHYNDLVNQKIGEWIAEEISTLQP